jgi:predicted dehydrogenase
VIVGLGRIGSTLESDALREKPCTHAGAIAADPNCVLAAGCDIDAEARSRFEREWGAPVYAGLGELLRTHRPDILIDAAYPESHREIAERAAAAGVPVIICEKPPAATLRDARAIARLHRRGAAKVVVNHERRYSRDYLAVRRAIAERCYGELLSVKGNLCFGSTAPRREVLLHDGIHMIDAVNFLIGAAAKPLRLRRRFGSMGTAGISAFLLGSCEGVPVVIEIGSRRDHLIFELELAFERGRVRVGNGVLSFERSAESPYYEGYRSLLPDETPRFERTGYFTGMLADAVRCARDPEHLPRSSAEDALEAMKCIRSVKIRA